MKTKPLNRRNYCSVFYALPIYVRGDVDGEGGAVLPFPKKARTLKPSHPAARRQRRQDFAAVNTPQWKFEIYVDEVQGFRTTHFLAKRYYLHVTK